MFDRLISTVWECPRCREAIRVYSRRGEIVPAFICTECKLEMTLLGTYHPGGRWGLREPKAFISPLAA
jgi:hypothetical protein